MARSIFIITLWLVFLGAVAVANAGCSERKAFGRVRGERLNEPTVRPPEVIVSLPIQAGVTAKCWEQEDRARGTRLGFLMNDEEPIAVVAPDDGIAFVEDTGGRRELVIRTNEETLIRLDRVIGILVRSGEAVYRGQPIGYAGSAEVFGATVGMTVEPAVRGTRVLIHADELDGERFHLFAPEDFVCELSGGHLYASRNEPVHAHPDGTMLRLPGDTRTYLVRGGVRMEAEGRLDACARLDLLPLVITSPGEMNCIREWGSITTDELCADLQEGDYPDGMLARFAHMEQVFVVNRGVFRPIADHGTFLALGYEEGMVRELPRSELARHRVTLHEPYTIDEARFCALGEPYPESPF